MQPDYNAAEVLAAIALALLPGASISQILLGILEKKTGIKVTGITKE